MSGLINKRERVDITYEEDEFNQKHNKIDKE